MGGTNRWRGHLIEITKGNLVEAGTDVASYIFNWHSLAQQYADALRGSELILSFMTIAEVRLDAISARWGGRRRVLLEQFMERFERVYADRRLDGIRPQIDPWKGIAVAYSIPS